MADGDTEVSVEIGAEDGKTEAGTTTNGAAGAATTVEASATGTVDAGGVTEGIEELRAKLADSEARRIAAESRAAGAGRSAEEIQRSSNLMTLNGAMEVLDGQMREHKAAYSAASAAGDWDLAAEIQAKMGRNSAERLNLEGAKFGIENQQPGRPAPVVTDALEAVASQLTPKSAAWVRAHPEYARDDSKRNLMIAAHYRALGSGLANESPEYFAFVEKDLGVGHSDARPAVNGAATEVSTDTVVSAAAGATQRRDTQPSPAPASRGTGSKRVIRLTPQEVEAAKISGMSNEEYARNKMREEERKKTTH